MGSSSKLAALAMAALSSEGGATTDTDTDRVKESVVNSSPFSVGEKVLAYHDNCLYEAKVQKVRLQMETFQYHIHYVGWKRSWDEWVDIDRLLKHTEENLQKQVEINKKHSGEEISKPGRGPIGKRMTSSAGRGRKRKIDSIVKEENEELENLVHIPIPPTLQKQLVDDCMFITTMGKLVKLPRDPNVEDILKKYRSYRLKKDGKNVDTIEEILSGLRSYFDKSLPLKLLYKNECQQYEEVIGADASPATVYGAEHLLRLFVKLPEILYGANIEEDTLKQLQQILGDFLRFLQKNQSAFFVST